MFLQNRLCYFKACSAKWLTHNIILSIKVRNMDLCLLVLIYLGKMKIRLLKYDRTTTIKLLPLNFSLWFPPLRINNSTFFHSDLFLLYSPIRLAVMLLSVASMCKKHTLAVIQILFIPFQGQGGLKRSTMKHSLHSFSSRRLQIIFHCCCRQKCTLMTKEYW